MYYCHLRFSCKSAKYFRDITGMDTKWYSSNARDLYYHMNSLARFVYKLYKNVTNGCRTTFRIYDENNSFVGDRFYFGQDE